MKKKTKQCNHDFEQVTGINMVYVKRSITVKCKKCGKYEEWMIV